MNKRSIVVEVFPVSLLLLAVFSVVPGEATTVAPPRNLGELASLSGSVVFAQAIESWVEEGPTIPVTITRFQLREQLAGASPGALFEVREPGGSAGQKRAAVAGAPRFETGRNYLLFLDAAQAGRWRSKALSYGLLEEAPGGEVLRPLREAERIELKSRGQTEAVGVYRKGALLRHLREVARGEAVWDRRAVAAGATVRGALQSAGEALSGSPVNCQFLTDPSDGFPIRWFGFEEGAAPFVVTPSAPGQNGIPDGGAAAVQAGAAAWTDHSDSVIRLAAGDASPASVTCSGNFDVNGGAVLFNDPCNDIADLSSCVGTLAMGGTFHERSTRPYDGELWHAALSGWVVINNGAECVGESFPEVVGHELGHTQGFGHHNPPDPAEALMSSQLKGDGLGTALRSTDKSCASYAYHTFLDVPTSSGFWRYIEAIENAGITNGCGLGLYCPTRTVTRTEMAVFLVRGSHGAGFTPPPATGTVFVDVPASYWAAPYIEQLFRDGLTKGCRQGNYCPTDLVKRSEMAVFLVRARHGSGFAPPPATGTVFQDVPAGYWAAAYIEQLQRDGVTAGCATNPARYCPESYVTRDQMAAFLARAYELPLP